MLTTFNQGKVRYSILTSPRARRDWEVSLDQIGADPSLWSARDDAHHRGGRLREDHELAKHRRPARRVAPLTHYSDKGRKDRRRPGRQPK